MGFRVTRRTLMRASPAVMTAAALGLEPGAAIAKEAAERVPEVTPPEDLMREHGVLNRVLLVYEAVLRKLTTGEAFDVAVISAGAEIVRDFIEGYHERNEEQHLFPRFRRAGQMVELVNVLYQQHQAGRRLTDTILAVAPASARPGEDRNRLIAALNAFIAMYRPHEAREDTVLFPKLRSIVSANEFEALAEDFERDEHRKFGEDGFETMVARVAALEQTVGIDDLAKVTPA